MNLLFLAAIGAGAYAYNKSPEFKAKADEAGKSISDLAKVACKEVKEAIEKAKAEKE